MREIADNSIHLMVTSPPYPMFQMWDPLFEKTDPEIQELRQQLGANPQEETVTKIYEATHLNLAKTWTETFRVLVDGGISCAVIGDATRKINSKFRVFPNHPKIFEHFERIGFTTLPYILRRSQPLSRSTRKRRFSRIRLLAAQRLHHFNLRIHPNFPKRKAAAVSSTRFKPL